MSLNVALPRPLGASLLLAGVLLLSGLSVATMLAGLGAATDELDAKSAFVTRSLTDRSVGSKAAAKPTEDRDLAVVAESGTLAAARVDALVRATVVEAGGTVLSSRAEAKQDEAGKPGTAERIEVQAVIQGQIDALQASLYHLESGTPMILVDNLSLRPGSDDSEQRPQAPLLTATLTLSAYWDHPKP
jgi:general secretion pathway protein M